MALAKEACELTQWNNWIPIDTLATATAASGDVRRPSHCKRRRSESDRKTLNRKWRNGWMS